MDFEEKIPALWHAFQALSQTNNIEKAKEGTAEFCPFGKLTVLIYNLCTSCLKCDGNSASERITYDLSLKRRSLSEIGHGTQSDGQSTPVENKSSVELAVNPRDKISFTDLISVLKPHFQSSFCSDTFDNITWMLCQKAYVSTFPESGKVSHNDSLCFTLWRLFNFYAEPDENGVCMRPVRVHCEEAERFLSKFYEKAGCAFDHTALTPDTTYYSFADLLRIMDYKVCLNIDVGLIESAMNDILTECIRQVLKRGWLNKAPQKALGSFRHRWFVLTPKELKYYESERENDQKGETIIIDPTSHVERKPGAKPRIELKTRNRVLDAQAKDEIARNEWITAMKVAIGLSDKKNRYREEFLHRAQVRREKERQKREEEERDEEERRKREEQRLRDKEEREKLDQERKHEQEEKERERREKEELQKLMEEERERERLARQELERLMEEERAKMEELLRKLMKLNQEKQELENEQNRDQEEIKRMEKERQALEEDLQLQKDLLKLEKEEKAQLEQGQEYLQQLLDDVQQAQKDAEIVQRLQAQALCEEMEKRKEIEESQLKMQELLESEKSRAQGLEESYLEQQEKLAREKEQLAKLQEDREKKEKETEKALAKLEEVEKSKKELEELIEKKKKEIPETFSGKLEKFQLFKADPNKIKSHREPMGAFTDQMLRIMGQKYKEERGILTPETEGCDSPPEYRTSQISCDELNDQQQYPINQCPNPPVDTSFEPNGDAMEEQQELYANVGYPATDLGEQGRENIHDVQAGLTELELNEMEDTIYDNVNPGQRLGSQQQSPAFSNPGYDSN